jgi:secreted Zn-dependent insulinase-like peptidase
MMRQQGPQQYIWDELKAVADMEFRFQDKIDAMDYGLLLKIFMPYDLYALANDWKA